MKIAISIDKLALSTYENFEIKYPYKKVPNYQFIRLFDPGSLPRNERYLQSYLTVAKYRHRETGNILFIANKRRRECFRAKPLYLTFHSSFHHPLTYSEVYPVERFFREKYNIRLSIAEIHLAIDLIGPKGSGLYGKILRSLKAGWKGEPRRKPSFEHSTYFGSLKSSNTLIIYDKRVELWRNEGEKIDRDVCRIELRLCLPRLHNFLRTLHDLALFDWSFVYPKFFSLHQPTPALKAKLRAHGEDWRQPIWQLRNLLQAQMRITPSNFYQRFLRDHPRFTAPVRRALGRYRWCVDSEKNKPP